MVKTPHSLCKALGSIPGQGARSYMPQQRTKIMHAATKAWCRQIIFFFLKDNLKQQNLGEGA